MALREEREVRDGQLVVRIAAEGGSLTVSLEGELDLATCHTAEGELLQALETSSPEVILDMGKLEFIDSTGIALLVAALRRSESDQLRFIPSESQSVARVLKLTGIDERLPWADSQAGAG
jgi:anti-sigma B factor antagonist